MKNILIILLNNLLILHEGSFILKLKSSAIIAFSVGTFSWCINQLSQWTISNQGYVAGVFICIAVDHLIGSAFHAFKLKDFTFKKNAVGLLQKLALCAASAILFEIIHNTLRDIPFIYEYLKTISRLTVILYPATSAFMNMSALTNGVFPPVGWIKRIKAFNEDLDIGKIRNGSDNSQQDKPASS